ncbi:hypothetical protein RHOER0001_6504 [Rhodococcus erythropolis SK121]|nr:hypothetical protein RHOER0001_6504 [Rhodococcus erythropolis SK121]
MSADGEVLDLEARPRRFGRLCAGIGGFCGNHNDLLGDCSVNRNRCSYGIASGV